MINSWKNNLLNLPDSVFFDIMRNYLGDLKTPFNKHDLMRSLTSFITRKKVKECIFSLIDYDDSRLLTAIALLESSTIDELYDFTRQYYSFLELHNRVANLQERLLIYIEYPSDKIHLGKKIIKINPVFEPELKEKYLDTSSIFSTMSSNQDAPHPWLNEQLIAAFLSFASSNRGLFRKNGNSRKRIEGKFADIFHGISSKGGTSPVEFLESVIKILGFITIEEKDFKINTRKIIEFGENSPYQRNIILAAAAVSAYSNGQAKNLNTSIQFMSLLFGSLGTDTKLHENDLQSFLFLIRRDIKKNHSDGGEITDRLLFDALSYSGFIIKDGDFRVFSLNSLKTTGEKLRIQSNFEISAPPALPLAEEIAASLCSEIVNYDITRTYELTKTSFASALDSGFKTGEIKQRLEMSSIDPIPQNILFSISAWEKEYNSISLGYGIVVTVAKERLPLIEHSPGLKDFFKASPAPGVYILSPDREAEWRKAFREAGFDMLPRIDSAPEAEPVIDQPSPAPDSLSVLTPEKIKDRASTATFRMYKPEFSPECSDIINNITLKINKLQLSKANKLKLEARAHKKLILSDSQLTPSSRPEEHGEAGGIDHRAKIRLTERAIELDNLLEVTTAKEFELEKRLIKPLRLVKAENPAPDKPPIFLIEGIELPEESELRIRITKISYLKMLKSSLFTP